MQTAAVPGCNVQAHCFYQGSKGDITLPLSACLPAALCCKDELAISMKSS